MLLSCGILQEGRGTSVCEPLKLRPSAKRGAALSLRFSGFSASQRGSFDVAEYVWCSCAVTARVRTIEKEKSCQNGQRWEQNTLLD